MHTGKPRVAPEHFEEAHLSLGKQIGLAVGLPEQELRPHRTGRLKHQLENRICLFGILALQIGKAQQKKDVFVPGSAVAQGLEVADCQRQLAGVSAADCQQLPGLQMPGIDYNDTLKERQRPRVVLLSEVDKPEVQEKCRVIRTHLEGTPVNGYRLIGAIGTGIDHAEIAERSDVAWLREENGLKQIGSAHV